MCKIIENGVFTNVVNKIVFGDFQSVIQYKNVYVPKTRIELKREYKIKVKTIYKDKVVQKAEARAEGKKNSPKGNLNLLFVGVGIGLLLSWLWKNGIKSII